MKISFRATTLWLVLCALALLGQAHTPTTSASLSGSVQSDQGNALIGASIMAVHLPTGVRRVVATDELGSFAIADMVAGGPYTVQVSQPGYRTQLLTNVFLVANKPVKLDVVLDKAVGSARPAARASSR